MRVFLIVVLICNLALLNAASAGQELPAPHSVDSNLQHHTAALAFNDGMRSVVASSNGRFLAFSNGSVWSLSVGGAIGQFGKDFTLYHLSAKGSWIAFAEGTQVKVWTLATGEVRTLASLDERPEDLVGNPDESLLAVVTRTGNPQIYETASGKLVRQLVWSGKHLGVQRDAGLMAFSPDGTLLACDTEIWNVSSGVSRLALDGSFRAFANNGRSVLTLDTDRAIGEWDLKTSRQTSAFDVVIGDSSARLVFSGDGKWMAISDPLNGNIALWDVYAGVKSKTIHLSQQPEGYIPVFLNGSDWLIVTTQHGPTQLVCISSSEEIAYLLTDRKEWAVVRSSDGAYDGSLAVVTPTQGRRMPLLDIDKAPLDQSRFKRVPGLLGKLPGAPVTP